MNARLLLSVVGLGVIALSFYLIFEYPAYADDAFYLLLGWMVVNFALLYAIRPRGAARSPAPATDASPFPSVGASSSTPLPSSSAPAATLGFCIYCATPLPAGARSCPACGHAVPQW